MFFTALLLLLSSCLVSSKPNIIFIVADDLGWNDVGFHNSDMLTPNIDALANAGMRFKNAYVQPVCTPSRHAFMTGSYPFRTGMQNGVIEDTAPVCSSFNLSFLPEKLLAANYNTYMLGKWHLGFCHLNCTPPHRGFEYFEGFYNGRENYYTKRTGQGLDYRVNDSPTSNTDYSAWSYRDEAIHIIESHDPVKPFFMYLSFQNPHSPINESQVPDEYEALYTNTTPTGRKIYSAMVSAMDDAIGDIVDKLNSTNTLSNTLIVFTSDNGGTANHYGNNWPLRGQKGSLFEGGTKAASFIYGAGLQNTSIEYEGLIHAVDWHPTFLSIAGGTPDSGIDGIDLWEDLKTGTSPSSRTEFVYNLDDSSNSPETGRAAIRVGKWKLISGFPGGDGEWHHVDNLTRSLKEEWEEEERVEKASLVSKLLQLVGKEVKDTEKDDKLRHLIEEEEQLYNDVENILMKRGKTFTGEGLYNLDEDPYETTDLSSSEPDTVTALEAKLAAYRLNYIAPNKPALETGTFPNGAVPASPNDYWSPGWC